MKHVDFQNRVIAIPGVLPFRVLRQNPLRTSATFGIVETGIALHLWTDNTVKDSVGWVLTAVPPYVSFTEEQYGDMVKQEFWIGAGLPPAGDIFIIEGIETSKESEVSLAKSLAAYPGIGASDGYGNPWFQSPSPFPSLLIGRGDSLLGLVRKVRRNRR